MEDGPEDSDHRRITMKSNVPNNYFDGALYGTMMILVASCYYSSELATTSPLLLVAMPFVPSSAGDVNITPEVPSTSAQGLQRSKGPLPAHPRFEVPG